MKSLNERISNRAKVAHFGLPVLKNRPELGR